MHKVLVWLLTCCLLSCASLAHAEMVRGQVSAPESVTAQWQSNSGKMQIYLNDVSVICPETERLYQIDVTPRLFEKEEMLRLLNAFQPEITEINAEYKTPYKNFMRLTLNTDQVALRASGDKDNGTWSNVSVSCKKNDNQYITAGMRLLQRYHEGNAYHCRYTMEEAKKIADAVAATIAPDYAYSDWGLTELYPRDGSDTRVDDYNYIEGYTFCYTPVMEGVQVTYTPIEDESEGLTLLPVRLPRLFIRIFDDGLREIVWDGAHNVGAKTPVAQMMPFEQIMEIAKSILPLAHMYWEQSAGDAAAMKLEKIELSYCRVQRRDKPGEFVMTPAWDFFGKLAQENQDGTLHLLDYNVSMALLTINAMDGTVIDRRYGY